METIRAVRISAHLQQRQQNGNSNEITPSAMVWQDLSGAGASQEANVLQNRVMEDLSEPRPIKESRGKDFSASITSKIGNEDKIRQRWRIVACQLNPVFSRLSTTALI